MKPVSVIFATASSDREPRRATSALFICALMMAGAADAHTFNVPNPEDPQWASHTSGAPKVLREAEPGDTIVLGPGHYGSLAPGYAVGKAKPGVTIVAAKGASVEFSGITFSAGGWHVQSGGGHISVRGRIEVANGNDFSFDGLDVDGLNRGGIGISYRNVSHLSITKSKIHGWDGAVSGLNATQLFISENTFSDSTSDLLHLGGNLSNSEITHNIFTDVHSSTLVHQDALQIFSSFATAPMADITIAYNQFLRGHSGQPVQAIFMNNNTATPFRRLTIAHNLIMMGNWWGIGVQAAENFSICDNYVGGFTDALEDRQVMRPWIKVTDSNDGRICNNRSAGGVIIQRSERIVQSGNHTVRLAAPDDLTAAMDWWGTNAAAPSAASE